MTVDTDRIASAMRLAIEESAAAQGPSTPNPPVGAILLAPDGTIVGRGHTQPPGGPHAEVMALRDAGPAAAGATAVVTLEPCNHTGRTGPCALALIDAGVAAVHYAVDDPGPLAAGGAETLRAAGVAVTGGVLDTEVRRGPLRPWLFRQQHGRPLVTVKIAATVDGRIAAPDGTSRWITGPAARRRVHRQRSALDAIVVGTGTVLADDPALTARTDDGGLLPHQPQRIAVGYRDLPSTARIATGPGRFRHVRSHRPADVVAAADDASWLLVEGGPRVIGAFLADDVVDEVEVYLAPTVLGAGHPAVDIPAARTLADARRFATESVTVLGSDVLLRLTR